MTKILKINYNSPETDKITIAADVLKHGGTVVFPTETVYGLGANALDGEAVKNIFKAKGRPSDNPLIVHVASLEDAKPLVESIPDNAYLVASSFCPGPLTIILKKSGIVPKVTTGGLDTVAVRIPNHNIALELIRKAKVPVAAPSANISGSPSPTCAKHVIQDLDGRVDVIIDGGSSTVGVESTVIDLTKDTPVIVRPGGVTLEQLKGVLGEVYLDPSLFKKDDNIKAIAPGMKYTHYSPNAEVIIVDGSLEKTVDKINKLINMYRLEGKTVGIMATDQTKKLYNFGQVISLGNRNNLEQIAANLFSVLREFDDLGMDVIIAESFSQENIGLAVMNRLVKAAGYNIIKV